MAYRTTAAAVKKIIDVEDDHDLDPFIETANVLVTDNCTSSDYSTAKLELLERWLSAHFYAIRYPRSADEKAGTVSVKYQHKLGLHLASTMYGQQVMVLDTAGNLASLNQRTTEGSGAKSVDLKVGWLGTTDWETE